MLIITVETSEKVNALLAGSCLSKGFDRPNEHMSLDLRGVTSVGVGTEFLTRAYRHVHCVVGGVPNAFVDEIHATSATDSCSATLHVEGTLRSPIDVVLRSKVEALLHSGVRRVLLDLSGVSDIDAAGVGELIRIFNMAAAVGGSVEIAGASQHVHRVLDVAGVLTLLTADAGT
jgi:anti-anti-sigma factor